MVLGCGTLWTALQILWSTIYIVCGAIQLMAAIYFLISIRELTLYGVIVAGSWNIIMGITGGMVACIGMLSPKRQEVLLYLAVSILAVNTVAVVLTEWKLYFIDMPTLLGAYTNHVLIDYALFVIRVAATTVIVVSFLDSQFAFCSAQSLPKRRTPMKKKVHGSHDQVSDIEYIIPRSKSTKSNQSQQQQHQVYDAYAQSWVFDAENAGTSNVADPAHVKILQNGAPKNPLGRPSNGLQNGSTVKEVTHLIDNPVVHIEEASDDSTSNSDRKLYHMKSFSRSASPVILSASSSQMSLNNYNPTASAGGNPPIYEYLEKLTEPQIYRSRLNTAVSNKSQDEDSPQCQYQASRRADTVSPQVVEPVQYASLMKELQRAIVCKKEPPSVTSPLSNSESHSKSSDAEFSKELEAALQLIQDLESPNAAETPSDPPLSRPLAAWRENSEASGSEKTLSAVGSMNEIAASPVRRHSPIGKGANRVLVRYPDSQSTSGYSSPSHGPTPDWSTTSSIDGSSNPDTIKPVSYHIRNAKSATVISLYTNNNHSKGKSVTLVNISGPVHSSSLVSDSSSYPSKSPITSLAPSITSSSKPDAAGVVWNVKSLLRKKKQVARLCPELESAIIKSESLAYLSEVELMARARRNEQIQRQIEERVSQQLGVPRAESESNC